MAGDLEISTLTTLNSYNDDDAGAKPSAPSPKREEPAAPEPSANQDTRIDYGAAAGHNGDYDNHAKPEEEDDEDDVDFNLGGDSHEPSDRPPQQQHDVGPPSVPMSRGHGGSKEDG